MFVCGCKIITSPSFAAAVSAAICTSVTTISKR
jgi:bacterioferritin-associated ferredoxin